jgi:hypothetical protein
MEAGPQPMNFGVYKKTTTSETVFETRPGGLDEI